MKKTKTALFIVTTKAIGNNYAQWADHGGFDPPLKKHSELEVGQRKDYFNLFQLTCR